MSDTVWRQVTLRYIFALVIVALLSITGQFVIHQVIDQQMSDADVINIAGRQRMLSQKIVKASLALVYAEDESAKQRYLDELKEAVLLWEASGLGLRYGDPQYGLPGENSETVQAGFADIDSSFQIMREAAKLLLSNPEYEQQQEALATLIAHEASFLSGMNDIVFQYAYESHSRVEQMRFIEFVLMTITLLTLILAGVFIFRPMANQVKEAINVAETNAQLVRMNKELETEHLQAQNAMQAKSVFLANMSHELRTPLNGVIGMADMMVHSGLTDEQAEYADIIQSSSEHLLVIINDILDYSKIEAGKLTLESQPFNLHKLVNEAATNASILAKNKPIKLDCVIDTTTPQFVLGDSTRVTQVLMNLLSNAVKFTAEGTVQLSLSALPQGDDSVELYFKVKDTGVGISPDRLAGIFESFEQADVSTTRKYGGTGLGLAISKHLCELMEGRIWVESIPGTGSTFYFTIRCKRRDYHLAKRVTSAEFRKS